MKSHTIVQPNDDRSFSMRARRLLSRPARIAVSAVLALSLCGGALAGCSQSGSSSSRSSVQPTASATSTQAPTSSTAGQIATQVASDSSSMKFEYSDRDLDASYDASSATKIELSSSGAQVSGNGAQASGSSVTISEEGTYVVSGSSSNAQIIVTASDSAKVQIVLAGVDMTCNSGPCINVQTADKVFVTLADGTTNTLSDGSWSLTGADDEANATLYSTCDLTINGNGSLMVNATVNDGIGTKDDLTVTGGVIMVNAADDGLNGNDSVSINGANVNVIAKGDGIKSSKSDDESKGFVTIDGGTVTVEAQDDGIQAARFIRLTGGSTSVNAADDALHSDLDVLVNGGELVIAAKDDAIHGEYYVDIVSGTVRANSCYEGLEGQVIEVAGGDVTVTSTDDGMNASVASTGSESEQTSAEQNANAQERSMDQQRFQNFQQNGMQGQGMKEGVMETSDACAILISGGTLKLTCEGDSIDSNGSILMSGGEVYVSGTTMQGNGAIDSGTGATITGGTIIATSAGGMEESFGSSSTQASVVANVSGNAGDVVSVVDSAGNEIVSYTTEHAYSWVLASTPDISVGQTYTVKINGNDAAQASASTEQQSFGMQGGMRGGAQGSMQGGPRG